jgi:DNA repair protein RecO (recombination protein O)
MQWDDQGIVIYRKTSSEKGAVVGLLTQKFGRWSGWLRQKTLPQLGECVQATWYSRLEDHLGTWKFEALAPTMLHHEGDRLMALSSLCQLCSQALPERHAYPHVFKAAWDFMRAEDDWREAYIFFELILLKELGFGLSLHTCAVTQSRKTGRAVCREAGQPYHHQLLTLPEFLTQTQWPTLSPDMYAQALQLTGYFINRHICHNRLPPLRQMLAA